ncbi:hypothetical protein H17ap60334_07438 [Thermosipho africanus H17ap60334]|uniref:DUF2202 domain-containing protein n=1 Tax=Thermosipho africanus TaxID=2421 RepID=UPI00028D1AA9|nr:DUF2202 domain-containing protein [Thermosipho africanus]EKF49132.1 hypothetical protein H17ap60334_07438 [Thermosipho africanus H17ap60334]
MIFVEKVVFDITKLSYSENHIRAFVYQLSRFNKTYTPINISIEEFNKIISD